jgi:hypothetical protein
MVSSIAPPGRAWVPRKKGTHDVRESIDSCSLHKLLAGALSHLVKDRDVEYDRNEAAHLADTKKRLWEGENRPVSPLPLVRYAELCQKI